MKQRRRIFIDPKVQGALALRICAHWLVYLLVSTLLLVGLMWLSDPFTPVWQHLATVAATYSPVLMVLLCLTPIFVYDAIKLSLRFSGPMYRIRRTVKELASGKHVSRIQLRKKDFWKDFARDLNRLMDRIEELENQQQNTDPKTATSGADPLETERELATTPG